MSSIGFGCIDIKGQELCRLGQLDMAGAPSDEQQQWLLRPVRASRRSFSSFSHGDQQEPTLR